MTQVATGSGAYAAVMGRVQASNSYRAKLTYSAGGGLALTLVRFVTTETNLVKVNLTGITATAGLHDPGAPRTGGFGPHHAAREGLAGRCHRAGGVDRDHHRLHRQPADAGWRWRRHLHLGTATAAAVLTFDRFTVSPLGTTPPPVNQPPTAAIGTPTINGLAVNLSGTGSTDSDGTITGYAWNYGDTTTGTGATTSHTYAAAGTYTVSLTVTDDDGATGTTTRQVTVTAPLRQPVRRPR